MRKTLLFAAAAALCLLLAACGAQSAQPTPAPTETPALSRAEHWREMDLAFDPPPVDIPETETWECHQPVYELREDGTEYGEFVWFDESGNTRREASYLGDFCIAQTDYDELGRFLYCFEADPDSSLLRESRYRYADTHGVEAVTRYYVDEQRRFEGFVEENRTTGVTESDESEFGEDNTLLRQTFTRIADGTAWNCVRSFEDGQIVTRYERDGVLQRTWTQYHKETGSGYDRAEMHDADGNLLFTCETDSGDGRTTETVTVPDCALTVRTENNMDTYINDVPVSTYRDGAFVDGTEAALRKYTDRATGNRRWVVLKDGETWMEIFWAAEPLGHAYLLDAFDISVRYGEPEPVSVGDGAAWTEEWQETIPLTDGELHFKDYAAVYAQLSESERKQPWSEKPYEVQGLGFLSGESLFDDPEAALNVHPEGWRVPAGGSMTERILPLIMLVQCTLPTAQQTNVLMGEIVEPWELLRYNWNEQDEAGRTYKIVSISVKPGAFDYDPDPNRSEGVGYEAGKLDLNDPGIAAHTFVGDMDSRIGRAKLAIRMEDDYRCNVSMLLDDTGYWVVTVELTQEEVTALLLSIVNSSPENHASLQMQMQQYLRLTAENLPEESAHG